MEHHECVRSAYGASEDTSERRIRRHKDTYFITTQVLALYETELASGQANPFSPASLVPGALLQLRATKPALSPRSLH